MPIYEFVCQACGHEFEQIVPFSAPKLPDCPACQSEQVHRQLSRPAIHFKGSGWYITDSKAAKTSATGKDGSPSKDGEKGEQAESVAESKDKDTPASTKTDTKTDTKTGTKSEAKSETKAASTTD